MANIITAIWVFSFIAVFSFIIQVAGFPETKGAWAYLKSFVICIFSPILLCVFIAVAFGSLLVKIIFPKDMLYLN